MTETTVTTADEFAEVFHSTAAPILVLFTAPTWCQPCRQFEPHWKKAQEAAALEGYAFVKVDMGESPEDTGEHWATAQFNIMGVPALKLFGGPETNNYSDVKARAIVPLIKELVG